MNHAEREIAREIARHPRCPWDEVPVLTSPGIQGVIMGHLRTRWPRAHYFHDAGWHVAAVYDANAEIVPNRDNKLGCATLGEAVGLALLEMWDLEDEEAKRE